MEDMKIRSMKVHEKSSYNYMTTLTLIMKRQWLKAGKAGTEVVFMEKEMKKHKECFHKEIEPQYSQFVAESNIEYGLVKGV